MKTNRGFTLIELLVVIAIIGILSSVVLASLNTARDKGTDAAIKANLANARAQAELFYDSRSNSYAGVCTEATGIAATVAAAEDASGTVGCLDSADGWTLTAELKDETQGHFCVDSRGSAATTSTPVLDGDDWELADDCN
jgi:prepilin-type N-terminal cleavage/methylation domain-containing protein